MSNLKDAIGNALLDFYQKAPLGKLTVISDISEDDEIPIEYLFRTLKQMPKIEQKALALCNGKVLDVGAASGCHSLELQKNNLEVDAIDISEGAVMIMKNRGVEMPYCQDFFKLENKRYDTLLFLMNGIGITGTIDRLPFFFKQCKNLINPNGQVLLDSSDIKYMFEEDDGSLWVDLNKQYYGEVEYQMEYKNYLTDKFNWLFIDFETLKEEAFKFGFKAEKIIAGYHQDYLARLTLLINN